MPVTILSNKTDVPKTIGHMQKQIKKAAADPQIQDLARTFLIFPIPEKAIFNYVYDEVTYVPDEGDYQDIRTPQRSLRDHVGNCVDYTVLIGSLLYALDIPFNIKVAEIEKEQGFEHVYIVTDKYIMDPCIGQPQDGSAIYKRPAKGKFNKETYHYNSKIYNMTKLRLLQGTARTSRAVKVANYMRNGYINNNKLGIFCLSNCACKNECSEMFGTIDTISEHSCRKWCDEVKAKRNDLYPSRDAEWSGLYAQMTSTSAAGAGAGAAGGAGAAVGAGAGDPGPTGDVGDIISDLFEGIFGPPSGTTTTGAGAPQPQPQIFGIPQNTALIIGAGLVIYFVTRKPRKRGRR